MCSEVTREKVFRAGCCPGFPGLIHYDFRFCLVLLQLRRLPLIASWLPPQCKFIPLAAPS